MDLLPTLENRYAAPLHPNEQRLLRSSARCTADLNRRSTIETYTVYETGCDGVRWRGKIAKRFPDR